MKCSMDWLTKQSFLKINPPVGLRLVQTQATRIEA
jgi:hypothetical protein